MGAVDRESNGVLLFDVDEVKEAWWALPGRFDQLAEDVCEHVPNWR